MNKKLRIAGVPEHYNAIFSKNYEELLNTFGVEFVEEPGGTGAMCALMDKGDIDAAFLLTEGAVVHAAKNPGTIKIAALFVKSPLDWGIHVGKFSSRFHTLQDLNPNNCTFAISRFGSGSHLMAYVLAKQELAWPNNSKEPSFEVVGGMDGALKHLPNNGSLVFLWNKTMTQQHVDSGKFRRIGVIPTPWPCFVLAIREDLFQENPERVRLLMQFIDYSRMKCEEFKRNDNDSSIDYIKKRYSLSDSDAREFLSTVSYDFSTNISKSMLNDTIHTLSMLNLMPKNTNPHAEDILSSVVMKFLPKSKL